MSPILFKLKFIKNSTTNSMEVGRIMHEKLEKILNVNTNKEDKI